MDILMSQNGDQQYNTCPVIKLCVILHHRVIGTFIKLKQFTEMMSWAQVFMQQKACYMAL